MTVALMVDGITEPMLTLPLGWWTLALVVATARQRVLPLPRPAGRHSRTQTPCDSPAGASGTHRQSVSTQVLSSGSAQYTELPGDEAAVL